MLPFRNVVLLKFSVYILGGRDALHFFKYLAEVEGAFKAKHVCHLVNFQITFVQKPFSLVDFAGIDVLRKADFVVFSEELS